MISPMPNFTSGDPSFVGNPIPSNQINTENATDEGIVQNSI